MISLSQGRTKELLAIHVRRVTVYCFHTTAHRGWLAHNAHVFVAFHQAPPQAPRRLVSYYKQCRFLVGEYVLFVAMYAPAIAHPRTCDDYHRAFCALYAA